MAKRENDPKHNRACLEKPDSGSDLHSSLVWKALNTSAWRNGRNLQKKARSVYDHAQGDLSHKMELLHVREEGH